ncbi:MAG: hypothetical protein FD123_4132 [Bacteroidetes bacterium]|nr:MAG: hypothetical protein FD123_4132 [Bacteroidota bacterium]
MTAATKLGIWIDHSSAHVMELTDPMKTMVVASNFSHQQKHHSLGRNENLMHNQEQHRHAEYYKELGEIIRNYEAVILFGPTDAKTELHNVLRADHRFSNTQIDVMPADKMTESQQHAFVREYFSKH